MVEVRNVFLIIIHCIGFWCGSFGILVLNFVVVIIASHFLLLSFTVDVTDSYIRLVCLNHIHILCRYYLRRDSKVVLLFVF